MKALIVSTTHPHYNKVGEIVKKEEDGRWRMHIPNKDGSLVTLVRDKDIKEVKRQDAA